ncbi:hypothetical protein N656DRAFT_799118 [Canariomyces notabilis]|uniref:Uncharacterized protein n=1 Tax=Canariomyces notabilis TaxID=2074819 RepID=A0AAN6TCC4_9PEZI|nr:hypothetical protein N656DRAFT_799118 [Canariomyces arenarius]
MHCSLILILLGALSPVRADNAPPIADAIQRDTSSAARVMVTPPPEARHAHASAPVEGRQVGTFTNFIGFASMSGYWYSQTCEPGQTFAVGSGGPWAACCGGDGATACNFATACRGNEVLFNSGSGSCGTQQCDTYTIFNSREVAATGIWSMIGCFTAEGFYDNPRTLYRNTFPLTTSVSTPTVTVEATQTVTQRVTVTRNAASPYVGGKQGWGPGLSGLFVLVMAFARDLLV